MANKLSISKPCTADLASLSSHPLYGRSASRRILPAPRYSTGSSFQRETSANVGPPQPPLLCGSAGNSQSQQSFSQGLAFSQPFSQLSQEEPSSLNPFEEWRSTRDGKQVGANAHASSQDNYHSATTLALSKANNFVRKLNQKPLPEPANFSLSKEQLEKRLETLDEGLSKVITVLDSMEGDLHKLSTAVQNASLDTEGIKQKVIAQENSLHDLLKEEELIKTTLTTGLKKLSEKKEESMLFKSLSDKLHMIPSTLTRHLAIIKKDLFTCIQDELQTIRECVHNSIQTEGYSTVNKSPYQEPTEVDSDKVNDRRRTRQNKKKDTEHEKPIHAEKRQYKKTKINPGSQELKPQPVRKTPTGRKMNQGNPTRKRGRAVQSRNLDREPLPNNPTRKCGRAVQSRNLDREPLPNTKDNGRTLRSRTGCMPNKGEWDQSLLPKDRTLRSGIGCKSNAGPSNAKHASGKRDPEFEMQIKNHRVNEYTFEMEDDLEFCEEEDTASTWQTGNVSWFEGEFGMEEEIKEMRRKIMKARKSRQLSPSVSSSN